MSFNFPKNEQKILKFWQERKIFEKLRKKNQGKKRWSFLDGPITANNPMGVHHAWGRTYKDLFQRYKAMQGFDQRFQNGFDCQGLWVEVEVEKEMGFKTKKDIEKFGIEKFVEACKKRVLKYSKIQTEQSIRLGQWMDWKNSYYTMSDENNYAIWNFLKKCWQKGFLYKGRDVVPWCPRCGTAISQHEILAEEYQEIVHKSVFLKLPVIGLPPHQKSGSGGRKIPRTRVPTLSEHGTGQAFFLVWTTTPWTLPANVALAVHPDLTYIEVRDDKGDSYILLKDKANLVSQGKIIKEFPGKELEGLEYRGMFDELEAVKMAEHKVILWKDVSEEEGTGIVHIAPGCGQEDFKLSKEFNLPVVDPTDEESKYKESFGFLSGKLVSEVHPHTKRGPDDKGGKARNSVLALTPNFGVGARYGVGVNDLIFEDLAKKGLVFKIEDYLHRYPTCWRCKTELIFRLVDEWYISMDKLRKPLMEEAKKIKWIPSFGLERELDWLKNMQDWLISKKRYWGLALPVYECECGNFEVIGSKEELRKRAVEGWEKFEGNSPHRPWVDKVKIKCSKCGKLVSRISDVGNPWLDAGIVPFSTMGYYSDKKYWGKWFPIELVCESFPGQFKNWFYAIIVMSVVLENKAPVKTIFGYASVRDEKGEEMHKSKGNVIWLDEAVEKIGADPMRWMYASQNPVYNLKFGYGPAEEVKRKLLTLYNVFVFFDTYVDKKEFLVEIISKNLLDKWIVSKLNKLIEKITRNLDRYNASVATTAIEKFFIDDLSLWYVRRSRKRFHPVRDYEIKKKHKENKSLTGFHQGAKGREEAIGTLYYILLNLIKIIAPIMPFFAEEMYSKLRLPDMPESIHLLDLPKTDKEKIDKELEEKMKEVREIITQALALRAEAGIKVRQPVKELRIPAFAKATAGEEELLELIKEEVNVKEITFGKELKLDTKITKELREEGIAREVVRHIQEMRKKAGLKPADKILVQYYGPTNLNKILNKKKDFILKETMAKDFKIKKPEAKFKLEKEIKLDETTLWLGLII